ncbi:uncharacterized protein LOC117112515 [Anneissia japonica]|uniref:uncharacterized protein LOC117112515 n=1 Tax=Anneissia japonica TaxID=1529436 RepID=UPI0014258E8B|nr:uncharacterized protein LOC117112515 [Anneissia japonica]
MLMSKEEMLKLLPEGSAAKMLWDEQLRVLGKDDSRQMRWHPAMIRFCIAIQHKSSAAYDLIRKSGFLCLPHQNTLRRYVHYTTSHAGINNDVLKNIVKKANFGMGFHRRYVSLVFDEMKLKSGLVIGKGSGRLVGVVDLDTINNEMQHFEDKYSKNKDADVASQMLVLMVRGICSNIHEPLCYYPGKGARGDQLMSIVLNAVNILELQGFRVKALVGDGASANRKMFSMLSDASKGREETYLCDHPIQEGETLAFFSDVPHLIKTTRNNWENSGWNKKSRNLKLKGKPVLWNHLHKLYEWDSGIERQTPGLRMLPKLSHEHVHLTPASRMRVYLAAQVLSQSVANALEMQGNVETKSTQYFIEMFNKFFDCMNVSNTLEWKTKRRPNQKPYECKDDPRFEWLTDTFLAFLNEWEKEAMETKGIKNSDKLKMCLSHQTLRSLQMTVKSFVSLTKELLQDTSVAYILSEKFSQDPLEEYFSKQRSAGGRNDNPTVDEFGNNFLRLHVAGPMVSAAARGNVRGNTRDGLNILSDEPLQKRQRKPKP